jgi:fatty acid desaturase
MRDTGLRRAALATTDGAERGVGLRSRGPSPSGKTADPRIRHARVASNVRVTENEVDESHRTGGGFDAVRKDVLVDRRGVRYRDFRRGLLPRYPVVWLHLLSGHGALFLVAAAVVAGSLRSPSLRGPLVVLASLAFGYVIAYIMLFFHEAAHYNIASSRRLNDTLANVLVGWLVGQDIAAYRAIHFDHHRHLGTPRDTESTYFDPLNVRFVAESVCGVKAFRVLASREAVIRDAEAARGRDGARRAQFVLGCGMHATVAGGAWLLGWWALAAAWVVGVAVVAPFFFALRQVLEHRDESADASADYRRRPHGPVNRLFGDGPLASTFGGAGFNRHLLHHWEPQISYTRLREMEGFLRDTEVAEILETRRTTYLRTFRRLFQA